MMATGILRRNAAPVFPGATWRDDLAHRCLKTFREDGWPVDAYAGKTQTAGPGADRDHRIGNQAWIGDCYRHTDLLGRSEPPAAAAASIDLALGRE
jgi:hypothetical protein